MRDLVEEDYALAGKIANGPRFRLCLLGLEDRISAAHVGMVKAARDYDPSRGTAWRSYLITRINCEILDAIRNESGRKGSARARGRGATYSLDRLREADDGRPIEPEAPHTEHEDFQDLVESYARKLPGKHAEAFRLHWGRGMTMRRVGEAIGYSESRVSQMLGQSLDWIREATGVNMPSYSETGARETDEDESRREFFAMKATEEREQIRRDRGLPTIPAPRAEAKPAAIARELNEEEIRAAQVKAESLLDKAEPQSGPLMAAACTSCGSRDGVRFRKGKPPHRDGAGRCWECHLKAISSPNAKRETPMIANGNGKAAQAEPCVECGTREGFQPKGYSRPTRCRGLCGACYQKSRKQEETPRVEVEPDPVAEEVATPQPAEAPEPAQTAAEPKPRPPSDYRRIRSEEPLRKPEPATVAAPAKPAQKPSQFLRALANFLEAIGQ